jgi:hypothetical protein
MCIVYITVGGSMGFIGNAIALGLGIIVITIEGIIVLTIRGIIVITMMKTITAIVVGVIAASGIGDSAVTLGWPPA